MIRLYLSPLVMLCAFALTPLVTPTKATELQPEYDLLNVISPSGGFVCGAPDYDLFFTLGEPVAGLSSSDSLLLWSGFVPLRCTCTLCPGVTGAGGPGPDGPPVARLYLVGPNPATRTVRIMCDLPKGTSARLAVYDTLGRQVRVLHEGPLPAGVHEVHWDGRNDRGMSAASGVYYARFADGLTVVTERIIVVR